MGIAVILNENPDKTNNAKVCSDREYTRRELRNILSTCLQGRFGKLVFYENFEAFKPHVSHHQNDLVINFDFGYKTRTRNMIVPSFCENYRINCFNPDPYVQIICQDKYITKKYAENFSIEAPKSVLVFPHTYNGNILTGLRFPLIIKPNYESESIGITQDSITYDSEKAEHITKMLLQRFDGVLIEEYIEGREIAITIIGNSDEMFFEEVELILPENNSIIHKAYTSEVKQHIAINIKKSHLLNNQDIHNIKQLYHSLSPSKLLRVDGKINNNKFYLIEINANPGLYPKSIVPRTFNINGYSYEEMMMKIMNIVSTDRR